MNFELVSALLRQRLTSPIRMALLAMAAGFPLLLVAFLPGAGLSPLDSGLNFALVLGAGMIGQDFSAGVVQLLFARPVRRSEYVLSRWAAVAGSASLIALAQVALGFAILASRGPAPSLLEALARAGDNALLAIGVAAVLAFLSSLAPGFADLGLYVLATVAGGALGVVGQAGSWPAIARAGEEVHRILSPGVGLALALGGAISWFGIVSYLSTLTLCLALAILVINRKELSYASG